MKNNFLRYDQTLSHMRENASYMTLHPIPPKYSKIGEL
jgi:hypothetical protein